MSWIDGPFFRIIEQILGTLGFFIDIASQIGKVCLVFTIGLTGIKLAFGGINFGEEAVKKLMTFIIFFILISNLNSIREGVQDLAYEIPFRAVYNTSVAPKIQQLAQSQETAEKFAEYSDIIREVEVHVGANQTMSYYVLDLYDEEYHFLRPNAIARLQLLLTETTYISLKHTGIHIGQAVILGIVFIVQLVGSVIALVIYLVSVIEFLLIFTVGAPFLGFMLWDATKYLAERYIGSVLAQTMKLIFITYVWMLVFSGYADMILTQSFTGKFSFDEFFQAVFISILYLTLLIAAPKLATALMSGTPQIGFADLAAGIAAAATTASAGKMVGHRAAKFGARRAGDAARIAGGAVQGAKRGAAQHSSKAGKVFGAVSGGFSGAKTEARGAMKDSLKSSAHNMFKRVAAPVQGIQIPGVGRIGGDKTDPSRHSQNLNMNERFTGWGAEDGAVSEGMQPTAKGNQGIQTNDDAAKGVYSGGKSRFVGRGENGGITPDTVTFGEYLRGNFNKGMRTPFTPSPKEPPQARIEVPTEPDPPAQIAGGSAGALPQGSTPKSLPPSDGNNANALPQGDTPKSLPPGGGETFAMPAGMLPAGGSGALREMSRVSAMRELNPRPALPRTARSPKLVKPEENNKSNGAGE